MVSDDKWHDIMKYKWRKSVNYYRSNIDGESISVHRYIMGIKGKDIVDHIDKNTRNNKT